MTSSVARSPNSSASTPMMSRMTGARMIASTKVGSTRKKSVRRMRPLSSRPPTNPATTPMRAPTKIVINVARSPIDHRDASAVDRQVEHVAAELVGAEGVRGRRRLERRAGRGRHRLERADEEVRRDREDAEDDQDGQPEEPVGAAGEPAGERSRVLDRSRHRSAQAWRTAVGAGGSWVVTTGPADRGSRRRRRRRGWPRTTVIDRNMKTPWSTG